MRLKPEGTEAERLDYARQLILPLAGDPVSVVLQARDDDTGRLVGVLTVVADEGEPLLAADIELGPGMWTVVTTYMSLIVKVHAARQGQGTAKIEELIALPIANLWDLDPVQAKAIAAQLVPKSILLSH